MRIVVRLTPFYRACAGKAMALDTVWIAVASVLAVFDIRKAVDADGAEIVPSVRVEPGSIRYVLHQSSSAHTQSLISLIQTSRALRLFHQSPREGFTPHDFLNIASSFVILRRPWDARITLLIHVQGYI